MLPIPLILQGLVLCGLLLAITIIDARQHIIPDVLNGALAASGLAFNASDAGAGVALEGLAVMAFFGLLALFYQRLRGRTGLGWGDVKFMGAATCWVGWMGIPLVTLVGSTTGIFYVLIQQAKSSNISPQTRIPFGPHLSLALLVVWFLKVFNGGP